MSGPTVTLRLSANAQGVAPGVRVAQAELGKLGRSAEQAGDGATKSFDTVNGRLATMRSQFVALASITTAVGLARGAARMADQWTGVAARLDIATKGTIAQADAMERVYRVAQSTSAAMEVTGTLVTRLAQSIGDMGLTGQQAFSKSLALAKTINQTFAISGAGAEAQKNAITQFTQALAGGILRAEEFNSIVENSPRLVQALADGLKIKIGELRRQVNDGEVTTQRIVRALESQAAATDRVFAAMPKTIGRAWTELENAVLRAVGTMDKSLGTSSGLAQGIAALAKNIGEVGTAVGVLAIVVGGRLLGGLVAATAGKVRASIAARALAVEELNAARAAEVDAVAQLALARAQQLSGNQIIGAIAAHAAATARVAAATAAVNANSFAFRAQAAAVGVARGALALLGGPIGLAITGLTLLVTWLVTTQGAAKRAADELRGLNRNALDALGSYNKHPTLADTTGLAGAQAAITAQRKAVKAARDKLEYEQSLNDAPIEAGGRAVHLPLTAFQDELSKQQNTLANLTRSYNTAVAGAANLIQKQAGLASVTPAVRTELEKYVQEQITEQQSLGAGIPLLAARLKAMGQVEAANKLAAASWEDAAAAATVSGKELEERAKAIAKYNNEAALATAAAAGPIAEAHEKQVQYAAQLDKEMKEGNITLQARNALVDAHADALARELAETLAHSAAEKRAESIAKYSLEAAQAVADATGPLAAAHEKQVQYAAQLDKEMKEGNITLEARNALVDAHADALAKDTAELIARNKAETAEAAMHRAAPQAYLDSLEAEIRAIGMSEDARKGYLRGMQVEAEMRRAIGDANEHGANISKEAADALIHQARAMSDYSVEAEKAAEQTRQWADVVVSAVDRAADAWSDFIAGGLKDYRKLASDLKDTTKQLVRDLMKTFLSQNFVKPLQDQLAALFSGNGFALGGRAGAGFTDLLSTAGGWLNKLAFGGAVAARGAAATTAAIPAAAGAAIPSGAGAAGGTAAMGSLAAVPIAGWVAIGMMANANLYQQGWDPAGQRNDMLKNILKDTAIAGLLVGGPAGALVGAGMGLVLAGPLALDSLLKSVGMSGKLASVLSGSAVITALFGHKRPEVTDQGIVGSFGFGGIDAQSFADITAKGGLFRRDKNWTDYQALDADIDRLFDSAAHQVRTNAEQLARQAGIDISAQLAAVKIDTGKLELSSDAQEAQEQLQQYVSDMVEKLSAETLKALGFGRLAVDGDNASEVMGALAASLRLVTGRADTLGRSLSDLERSAATRGVQYFQQLARDRGTALPDEVQRVTGLLNDYASLIGGVHSDLLARGLSDAQRSALEIESTYRQQVQQANALAKALGLAGARTQDLTQIELLRAARMEELTRQIHDQAANVVNGLSIGDLSPLKDSQKLTASMDQLRAAVTKGDVSSAQQLAQSTLGFGRDLYASGQDYDSLYAAVTALLEQMGLPALDTADGTTMGDLADILLDLPLQIGSAVFDAMVNPNLRVPAPSTPPLVSAQAAPIAAPTAQAAQETNGLLGQILATLLQLQKQQQLTGLQASLTGR